MNLRKRTLYLGQKESLIAYHSTGVPTHQSKSIYKNGLTGIFSDQ
jgi:hypothetical protein